MSERTIREWLSRIDKDAKEARNRRIFDLWLACWTEREIAEAAGCDHKTVSAVWGEMAGLPKLPKTEQAEKTAGSSHFGNSEVRWLESAPTGQSHVI